MLNSMFVSSIEHHPVSAPVDEGTRRQAIPLPLAVYRIFLSPTSRLERTSSRFFSPLACRRAVGE